MIRRALLILLMFAGIATAALAYGTVAHLRALAPGRLPAWTEALTPNSGLWAGTAAPAPLPDTTLTWSATLPDLAGLRWRVRLNAPGVSLNGTATLPWGRARLRLGTLAGTVDLRNTGMLPPALTGTAVLTRSSVTLARDDVIAADITALLTEVVLEGTALGDGPLTVTIDPDGAWTATLALTGGAADGEATASGQRGEDAVSLVLMVVADDPLPAAWTDALDTLGRRQGDRWTITTEVSWAQLRRLAAGA